MALVPEMLVAASSIESPLLAWDIQTGKVLASYKQSASLRHCLVPVGSEHLAASQASKGGASGAAIFIWNWKKSSTAVKSFPNEAIKSMCCSVDGSFLIGGGDSGVAYIWEVSTGLLIRIWPAHYTSIESVVLSDDDSVLITGGKDGMVNVWSLPRLLDQTKPSQAGEGGHLRPMFSFHEHSQRITHLFCGTGGGASLLLSSSEDRTCKFFSLGLGMLLRSVIFPIAINVAITDPGEFCFYAGGSDGRIFVTSLLAARVEGDMAGRDDALLQGHKRAVTSLAFCLDGIRLVSGSDDGTACIWCTVSRKLLRRIEHPRGPITCIIVVPKPPQLPSQQEEQATKSDSWRVPPEQVSQLKRYPVGSEGGDPLSGNPWEGPPVALPRYSESSLESLDEERGAWRSHSRATADRQMMDLKVGGCVESMQSSLEQKDDELKRALDIAENWKLQFDQSFQIASELVKHVDQLKGLDKDRVGASSGLSKNKLKTKVKGMK